jgi:hypothetical protein
VNNNKYWATATAVAKYQYFDTVQAKWGKNYFPLCVTVSGDDLALTKSQTAGACPWYVHIANLGVDEQLKPKSIDCYSYSPAGPSSWNRCMFCFNPMGKGDIHTAAERRDNYRINKSMQEGEKEKI